MSILDLPIDVMASLALELNLPDILSLCETSTKFNYAVCLKESFWLNKLSRDYPDYQKLNVDMSNHILNMPVNNLFLVKILDEKRINMVQSWLLHCRTLHPHNHLFKTE